MFPQYVTIIMSYPAIAVIIFIVTKNPVHPAALSPDSSGLILSKKLLSTFLSRRSLKTKPDAPLREKFFICVLCLKFYPLCLISRRD